MIPKSCGLFGQDHTSKQKLRAGWRFNSKTSCHRGPLSLPTSISPGGRAASLETTPCSWAMSAGGNRWGSQLDGRLAHASPSPRTATMPELARQRRCDIDRATSGSGRDLGAVCLHPIPPTTTVPFSEDRHFYCASTVGLVAPAPAPAAAF